MSYDSLDALHIDNGAGMRISHIGHVWLWSKVNLD